MRKVVTLTLIGAAVLASVWFVGLRVAQSKRNSAYRTDLARFEHDLPIGTSKSDVKKYLDSRNIQYYPDKRGGSRSEAYEIKIGEDPGNFACEPWEVYVALEFNSDDVLKQVHLKRSATCL